jgi:hypothetical protein
MVQDLKRTGSTTVRRRESVLGLGVSDEGMMGEPLGRRRTGDEESAPSMLGGRGRSLSGTLGELWTRVKGKSSREGLRDEEVGPNDERR